MEPIRPKPQAWLALAKRVPLLALLGDDALAAWLDQPGVQVRRYAPGELIHLADEPCRGIEAIVSGQVTIEHSDEHGRFEVITEVGDGDLLGGQVVFSRQPVYPMTLIAASETVLIALERSLLVRLLQENELFLMAFLRLMSDNASRLSDKIRQTLRRSIRENLIGLIAREIRRQGTTSIRLPLSKKALADRWGVQRTSISRELQKMRREHLLTVAGSRLTWLGPDVSAGQQPAIPPAARPQTRAGSASPE
ncbi:MAG: Crp/Fnr family transcriptional regulator [Clostridiaceae bacterium]|jgi:CRP-like cAMP-binding protein|nr:Crp/Fnr family transcriptional regulator [Clostridiaceae bacterium]